MYRRAVKALIEHRGEILGDAIHAPRTDRFDTRLFHRLEYGARLLGCRLQPAMHRCVVAGKTQRDRISVTPNDRGFRLAELARRLRQTNFPPPEARAPRRE